MSGYLLSRPSPALVLALLAVLTASPAMAARSVREASGAAVARAPKAYLGSAVVPSPLAVLPLPGDHVSESMARIELSIPAGIAAPRVVIGRVPFDPAGWTSLPSGPAWTVVPYTGEPIALAPLHLADPTDTRLWWAVVWDDPRTGRMLASETREFTLVPRFANRAGTDGVIRPSASGRLSEIRSTGGGADAPRRVIALSAGYVLMPGAAPPALPARLTHVASPTPAGPDAREAYIVQFTDASPDSARARIAAAGGEVAWPISGDGWVVRMGPEAAARLRAAGGQPWIARYEPAYKLSPALDLSATSPVAVTALLFSDGDDVATLGGLRALGASRIESHRGSLNKLVRFELDPARLPEAVALADIAWLEPTPEFKPSNDQSQWVVQTGVPESRTVTDHGIRGQDQIVMVADSGVRTNHEMFNDSTLAIPTWGDYPTHRKIVAYKPAVDGTVDAFGDVLAYDYHGTHTTGTVAGDPSPYSTARWSGIARGARIYFMDCGTASGGNLALPADLNDLFQPSYDGNAAGAARISSNSWGAFVNANYTLSSMQTDQFVWTHPDYLIAFASGNVGLYAAVNSPGTAKNVVTVGATGNGTLENTFASFSSKGPAKDGRRKPTVCAPGDLVTSSIGSTRYSYATYSGTSMATPGVAGAIALMRQYLTDGWYPTGAPVPANGFQPSAALLRAMTIAAGRNDVQGYHVPDNAIGYGRITIDDVLYFPGDALRTLLIDPADGLQDQDYVEYQIPVTDPGKPLKVALCWTDAPGNPAAAVQLVNDLDLIVTGNDASYRGNYMANDVSFPGGSRDSLNVEEMVRIPAPAAGVYTVRVEAKRVLQGPQRFALCVTGGVGGPAGAIALDRFQYGLRDTLDIEVIDTDAAGPITARASSSTEPWNEPVVLTGANGVYRGRIPIGPVLAQMNDGIVAVTSGDLITVTYTDPATGTPIATTARVNIQAPTITAVHAQALGATQALVSWTTDVPGSSRVRFGGASGALASSVDSSGFGLQHAVLLAGLKAGTLYRYDVESTTPNGDTSRDSLGGAHRTFTTRANGPLALLMDDPDSDVLAVWNNAFAALGWDVDVMPAAVNDPPLVGNTSAGLRRYDAVLWQVDPNRYPPFTDAQRTAIDSLLDHGGRLLVTGHDIGFGLSDAGAPSYTPEREAWIESGLKTRYYLDNLYADTLTGVAGSPVSGAYTDSIPYAWWMYPDCGDNVGPAPGTDGVWSGDWTENYLKSKWFGMHWESNTPVGTPGLGVWGGQKTRLVGLFYEWNVLQGAAVTNLDRRTGVLRDAVSYLLGHRPPQALITAPAPGTYVTGDFVAIRFSIQPDAGRAISTRVLDYSLDGGETWAPITSAAYSDSGCIWDLAGALGGPKTPNSARVLLRLRVKDDGSPSLGSTATMAGVFTLARSGGDTRGPVLVAGSASCSPLPIRRNKPTLLFATFSDGETGGGTVTAAEYSIGAAPVAPGSGTTMTGLFGGTSVKVSAAIPTANILTGDITFWVRGRDAAGNWGAATSITVTTSGSTIVGVADAEKVDFLADPSPNPSRGEATLRFGLAVAGPVRLELFDLAGRRVRTLADGMMAPGPHVSRWDGRDQDGHEVKAGMYFVRLTTPARVFHTRMVALR